MRATSPARALVFLIDVLDRYWGLLGVLVIVALEALVFAPRGMTAAMIGGGYRRRRTAHRLAVGRPRLTAGPPGDRTQVQLR